MLKKYYVTTPLYYGTGRPHLGSLYSTLLADVSTRWHKLKGYETFFLTGTDEHGQKIAESAAKAGKKPKELVNTLLEKGDVYKGVYEGWYCVPDETFVPGKHKKGDVGPACPSCNRETIYISETCYFFKLSAYQDKLLTFFKEHPDFIYPKERLNEVIAFVESGLKDLCISRSTVKWGIPFPGEDDQVIYVWADALTNYIAALGYGDEKRAQEFAKWWPADLHIMAKDIVRFHAVYWIAFLMAIGVKLPHHLLVHGWITIGGQKMSKSLGNAVDPQELLKYYDVDALRYYLVSHFSTSQDSTFSIDDLE